MSIEAGLKQHDGAGVLARVPTGKIGMILTSREGKDIIMAIIILNISEITTNGEHICGCPI
jgi:hypothetical protein